jgi:hypothetical protein
LKALRLLDDRFDGSEQRFKAFVRGNRECRSAILQCAGLDPGDAELVDFRPRFYGVPDVVVRLPDRRLAVIELCFELSLRHAFRDFAYVLDPAIAGAAAIIWVCDAVPATVPPMIRHYARQFALDRRISFEILVASRIDESPPMRFSFVPQLGDLRAGAPRRSQHPATVAERLTDLLRTTDEIDTVSLARLLGTTQTWITLHASRKERALRLVAKHTPIAGRMRGADGRFLFELERVLGFVSDFEQLVAQLEAHSIEDGPLPLLSARDPRIGSELLTLEMFRASTVTRQYHAIRQRLGAPAGFIISTASRGYSLVWPSARQTELRPPAVNDNQADPAGARAVSSASAEAER